MLSDVRTVMWKERKSLFRFRGSRSKLILTLLSPVFLGVYMPISMGTDWLESVFSPVLSVFLPVIFVSLTVPDSFAGERERHTLETLLASRLPDRAILFGKALTGILFASGGMLAFLLLGVIAVNVAHW